MTEQADLPLPNPSEGLSVSSESEVLDRYRVMESVIRAFPWAPTREGVIGVQFPGDATNEDYEKYFKSWEEAKEAFGWSDGDTEELFGPIIDSIATLSLRPNIVYKEETKKRHFAIVAPNFPKRKFEDHLLPTLILNGFTPIVVNPTKDAFYAWFSKEIPDGEEKFPGQYL